MDITTDIDLSNANIYLKTVEEWIKTNDEQYYHFGKMNDIDMMLALKHSNINVVKRCIPAVSVSAAITNTAIFYGDLDIIKLLHREEGFPFDKKSATFAIRKDNLRVLKYLERAGAPMYAELLDECLVYDSIRCLKYLWDKVDGEYEVYGEIAVAFGSVSVLRFIGMELSENELLLAFDENNLATFKYIWDQIGDIDAKFLMHECGQLGKLDFAEFIYKKTKYMDQEVAELAAMKGHLDMLKFAHSKGCELTDRVLSLAIIENRWKCVRYINSH